MPRRPRLPPLEAALEPLTRALDLALADDGRRVRNIGGLDHLARRAAGQLRALSGPPHSAALADALEGALPEGWGRASRKDRLKACRLAQAALAGFRQGQAPEVPDRPYLPGRDEPVPETVEAVRESVDPGLGVGVLKGVGARTGAMLEKLGLATVGDLAMHLPRTWLDRRTAVPIAELQAGQEARFLGQVRRARGSRRGTRQLFATVSDGTAEIDLAWFRAPGFLFHQVRTGRLMSIVGTPSQSPKYGLSVHHPETEFLDEPNQTPLLAAERLRSLLPEVGRGTGPGLNAVYPLTAGLSQWKIRKLVAQALAATEGRWTTVLPQALRDQEELPDLGQALAFLHQPPDSADLDALLVGDSPAHRAMLLRELYITQVGLALRRRSALNSAAPALMPPAETSHADQVRAGLGFSLTGAQERVIGEILGDLQQPRPMRRLLQGDVGAGKTVVALFAALAALEAGYQVALLAPTTILAQQHLQTFQRALEPLGYRCALLTGGMRARQRRVVDEGLLLGRIHLVCGTHALFQEKVQLARLGLVVVDEQHRFGVAQRAALVSKGGQVHLLAMTATPIPRSLALTLYGDLEFSVLDELPRRGQRTTKLVADADRATAYQAMRAAVERGERGFVICPLVTEIEGEHGRDAVATAEELRNGLLSGLSVGLLHGRMLPEEKLSVVEQFRNGALSVLVSTTVIEVGVDVPDATVLVIEGSDRFGLSQLHQLRGRVGRSALPSEVFLLMRPNHTPERLTILAETDDGFRIAEHDLRIRGPGDLLGLRQSGQASFALMGTRGYAQLLELARRWARQQTARADFDRDPETEALRREVQRRSDLAAGSRAG